MIDKNSVLIDGLPEIQFGSNPLRFRIVFDSRKYKNCHAITVQLTDSAGGQIPVDISRWGTKMNVEAKFDPMGVEGLIRVSVGGPSFCEIAKCWFVR